MLAHKPNGECFYLNEHGCSIHGRAPSYTSRPHKHFMRWGDWIFASGTRDTNFWKR